MAMHSHHHAKVLVESIMQLVLHERQCGEGVFVFNTPQNVKYGDLGQFDVLYEVFAKGGVGVQSPLEFCERVHQLMCRNIGQGQLHSCVCIGNHCNLEKRLLEL